MTACLRTLSLLALAALLAACTSAPTATVSETTAPPVSKRGFSLTRLLAVASREGKELLRDKVRMAFALLGAMFMMVIFGFGISLDVEKLAFAVYDQDQTPQSRAYLEAFRSSRYFEEKPTIRSSAELHRRLQRSEIKLALEIPPGFGRDLHAGRQPVVAAWLDGGMPFRAETSRNYVEAVHLANLQQLAEQSSPAINHQAGASLETRFRYNQDVVSVNAIGPGVMALILAFIPAMLTALGMLLAFVLSLAAGRLLYLRVEQHVPTWSTALRWQAGLVGTGLLVAVTNNGF